MVSKKITEMTDGGIQRPGDIVPAVRDGANVKTTVPGAPQTLTDAPTIEWDASLGTLAKVTLGGNRIMGAPTNLVEGQEYSILFTQDDTGGRSITEYDTIWRFEDETPPVFTTTALYSNLLKAIYTGGYLVQSGFIPGLKLFEPPPPPDSIIVNIIPIEITLTAPAKTNTQDISSYGVDLDNKPFIHQTGCYCPASGVAYDGLGHLKITDANTVTASRNSGNTPVENLVVRGILYEFAPGVVESTEDRTISVSGTSSTQTLNSAVTFSRSFASYRGHKYSASDNGTGVLAGVALISGTQARGWAEGSGSTVDIEYTAVQLAAEYVVSVQNIAELLTGTNTTDPITISAVEEANTMMFYNGISSNSGANWNATATRFAHTSPTNVNAIRNTGTECNRRVMLALIEWVDGILATRQANTITMAGVSSNTFDITDVDPDLTAVHYHGMSTTQSSANGFSSMSAVKLASAGATVQANKGDNSTTATAAFGAYTFASS